MSVESWRRALWLEREGGSTLAVSTLAGIENSATVAKQKQLPSAGLPI